MRPAWAASLTIVAAAGCAADTELFVERVWGDDEPAVVVAVTDEGARTAFLVSPSTAPRHATLRATSELTFYARTYEELEDRDTSTCVTTFGPNDDLPLGTPSRAWSGRREGDSIRFTPETDPRAFDLRIRGCDRPVGACDVGVRVLDGGPTANSLSAVVAPRDDFALIAGSGRADDDPRTLFLRYERDAIATLPPTEGLRGRIRAMEYDGARILAARGRHLVFLDERMTITSSVAVGFEIRAMEVGDDGAAYLISDDGELAFLASGATDVVPVEPPRYGDVRADQLPDLDVVDADEFVIFAPDGTLWRSSDGMWERLLESVESRAIATDGETVIIARDNAPVLFHHLGRAGWDAISQAFTMQNAIHAEAIGDGRYLIAGQTGTVAYYNGREMCTVPSATDRNIEDFDFAPSKDFAYAAGENYADDDLPSLLMQWTIPRHD